MSWFGEARKLPGAHASWLMFFQPTWVVYYKPLHMPFHKPLTVVAVFWKRCVNPQFPAKTFSPSMPLTLCFLRCSRRKSDYQRCSCPTTQTCEYRSFTWKVLRGVKKIMDLEIGTLFTKLSWIITQMAKTNLMCPWKQRTPSAMIRDRLKHHHQLLKWRDGPWARE